MKRFWTSWYSGNYADEGCTKPPFEFWVSGQKERQNYGLSDELYEQYSKIMSEAKADKFLDKHSKDDCSICAVIDAENEDEVWKLVAIHFPDYDQRFCDEREKDFNPGSRFS